MAICPKCKQETMRPCNCPEAIDGKCDSGFVYCWCGAAILPRGRRAGDGRVRHFVLQDPQTHLYWQQDRKLHFGARPGAELFDADIAELLADVYSLHIEEAT